MKRRIETILDWDLKKFDQTLAKNVGIETNLPIPIRSQNRTKLRIEEVSVSSSRGGTGGRIYVTINQEIGGGFWGADPAEAALHKLFDYWYKRRVGSGSCGTGPKHFSFDFELSRNESSFCKAALWRVILALGVLGITRIQIPNPKITQRTYVWVPKDQGWKNALGLTEFGWVDFGVWLGAKYGLGGIQPLTKSLSSENF